MKRIRFIICLAVTFVAVTVLANDSFSPSNEMEALALANQPSWEYGYLRALGNCSGGKKVKVVSQIFRWCRADFGNDNDKFQETNKYDVLQAVRNACGSGEYELKPNSYVLVSRFTKGAAEKEREYDMQCENCEYKRESFHCSSCEAYSSKCK